MQVITQTQTTIQVTILIQGQIPMQVITQTQTTI
jgi:hypothetical protein